MQKCDRCKAETVGVIMSMFNTQDLCSACKRAETKHPDYEKAAAAELRAVKLGLKDFAGIGAPPDLRGGR